jgi:hypothetical protein
MSLAVQSIRPTSATATRSRPPQTGGERDRDEAAGGATQPPPDGSGKLVDRTA